LRSRLLFEIETEFVGVKALSGDLVMTKATPVSNRDSGLDQVCVLGVANCFLLSFIAMIGQGQAQGAGGHHKLLQAEERG
jgi:hypothetical protein